MRKRDGIESIFLVVDVVVAVVIADVFGVIGSPTDVGSLNNQ